MARVVHLACARCGHPQMLAVDSAENDEALADIVPALGDRSITGDDRSTAAALRLERLKLLPTSMPVGGIITPV
ncbi:MAG TPA: hypothetical protein VGU25_11410 [Acidobacteriaceae bacterium]|nr:hypothetical protein [Acidobacteriaceae bacterium]